MSAKISRLDEETLAIESTVMAIREKIMEYYKGTCVERLTQSTNVKLVSIGNSRGYLYQRIDHQNKNPKLLFVGNVPIARIQKYPDILTINTSTLGRSKQLKKIQEMLEEFMTMYLAGVTLEKSDANIIYK